MNMEGTLLYERKKQRTQEDRHSIQARYKYHRAGTFDVGALLLACLANLNRTKLQDLTIRLILGILFNIYAEIYEVCKDHGGDPCLS